MLQQVPLSLTTGSASNRSGESMGRIVSSPFSYRNADLPGILIVLGADVVRKVFSRREFPSHVTFQGFREGTGSSMVTSMFKCARSGRRYRSIRCSISVWGSKSRPSQVLSLNPILSITKVSNHERWRRMAGGLGGTYRIARGGLSRNKPESRLIG